MKVFLTGSTGMLGTQIKQYCVRAGWNYTELDRAQFDWKNVEPNVEKIGGHDVIIHTAANTNVEFCESNYEAAYRDNTLLTERLALASYRAGTKFVYISSTGVYGNHIKDRPYHEYDLVKPTTHHHHSKLLAEKAIQSITNDYLIIRTGWVFGGSPDNKKNFVARRIEEALCSDGVINCNDEQVGCPTYTDDLTTRIFELIKNNEVGLYNCTNENFASRLEYVRKILTAASINVQVRPASAESFNRNAPVSDNETATNLKLRQMGYSAMPDYEDSLLKYIREELSEWITALKAKHNATS